MRRSEKIALFFGILAMGGCSFELDRVWVLPDRVDAPCPPTVDRGTVALFSFEGTGSTISNRVSGGVVGELVGTEITRVPGPRPTCGGALAFPVNPTLAHCDSCIRPGTKVSCASNYGRLPGTLGSDLRTGSIDFWIYLEGKVGALGGVISRDAIGRDEGGHLSVSVSPSGAIAVRVQDKNLNSSRDNEIPHICSPALTRETWHHVGVNFGLGGLELTVNGRPYATTDADAGFPTACHPSGNIEHGLDGNDEPWLLGAAAYRSCPDSLSPPQEPFVGRLANLRISSIRRDFTKIDFSP